jgi:hypothetical protein
VLNSADHSRVLRALMIDSFRQARTFLGSAAPHQSPLLQYRTDGREDPLEQGDLLTYDTASVSCCFFTFTPFVQSPSLIHSFLKPPYLSKFLDTYPTDSTIRKIRIRMYKTMTAGTTKPLPITLCMCESFLDKNDPWFSLKPSNHAFSGSSVSL